jgi:LPXTG-motif cell wall-anchored protein
LPNTGVDPQVWMVAGLALVVVLVGAVILARRHRTVVAAALLIVVGVSLVVLPAAPARADGPHCSSTPAAVGVVQTSVMAGLAPGIAPVPIEGLVENIGTARIHVIAVDVEITSVSTREGMADGPCDATDYVIRDTHMPVDRSLDAGRTTPFAGASIGFSDKPTRQDACQNATVHLLYTVQALVN